MASGPGHEASLTSTVLEQIFPQLDDRCEGVVHTDIDGANPFRFLLGAECPPFFPYRWLCTGGSVRIVRTKHAHCGPENDQSGGKKNLNFMDGHVWEKKMLCKLAQRLWVYLFGCLQCR